MNPYLFKGSKSTAAAGQQKGILKKKMQVYTRRV
jgi:hypothetical protein